VSQILTIGAVYGLPALLIMGTYWQMQRRGSVKARHIYQESVASGLLEPASLHPVIDYARCLGCGTCVKACPEKSVLGLISNRAELITPSSCIGHGACKTACPTQAITLVFGTATRGVDIPQVGADFQTNIPGIYIAGELGGMGLIRNAIEQGRQAIEAIARNGRKRPADQLDVLIIGAGPAGISAAMAAKQANLSYQVLEQDTVGGTIAHYPRGKVVMTAPAKLPIVGEFQFAETRKEDLMEFWTGVVEQVGLDICTGARVEGIDVLEGGFEVRAGKAYRASNVLLAIGRRGTPRKLGVPGEDHSKVVYRLQDPLQYRGQKVLVVGGGDSALEAAVSLSEEPGTEVILSYRGAAFNRVKAKNRERVAAALDAGRLQVELGSQVRQISADAVLLDRPDGEVRIANDAVIVCAGGILPSAFLESVGIAVETRYGTA
jgi:thioredoxin reductase/NAD-dependent dihydropyrimidine dehydrogenase PreA subunit